MVPRAQRVLEYSSRRRGATTNLAHVNVSLFIFLGLRTAQKECGGDKHMVSPENKCYHTGCAVWQHNLIMFACGRPHHAFTGEIPQT